MWRPDTTRWSLIARAATTSDPQSGAALAELCAAWRPAVVAFLRRRVEPQLAEDLAQEFFVHLLDAGLVARADPARGSFRAYVYTSLRRWCIDRQRAEAAQCRDPARAVGADALEALFDPGGQPDVAFDRAWASCLLQAALDRLRAEAERSGRLALYEAAAPFLLESPDDGDYAAAATALSMRPNTFAVAVKRLRGRLQALVRTAIADSTAGAASAAGEQRRLRGALQANGRSR